MRPIEHTLRISGSCRIQLRACLGSKESERMKQKNQLNTVSCLAAADELQLLLPLRAQDLHRVAAASHSAVPPGRAAPYALRQLAALARAAGTPQQ